MAVTMSAAMPDAINPIASVAAARAAPSQIAAILKAYSNGVAGLAARPPLPTSGSEAEQSAAGDAVKAELAGLKQQAIADLRRLENDTWLALADARSRLEAAILPGMSGDPHVQRVFELRQAKALARLTALLDRAETEAAVDESVRRFADEAARQGDWAALRVLRAETGPCLERRGIEPGTSEALRIIDQTLVMVRPRAAGALAERRAFEAGAVRVTAAFEQARNAIASGQREVRISSYEADAFEDVALPAAE